MPRSTVTTRTACAIAALATRAMPAAVSSSSRPSSLAQRADRALRRRAIEAHAARERRVLVEVAEQQVGVGDRRLARRRVRSRPDPGRRPPSAAPRAARRPRRARRSSRRRRPRCERRPSAARAPGRPPRGPLPTAAAPSTISETSQDVPPMSRPDARRPRRATLGHRAARAHRAARRARQHGPRRVPGGGGRARRAAAREHHLGLGQPGVARALGQPLEVAAQQRRQRGVDDRGGAALVLAEHARGLVRGRHVDARQRLLEQLGGAPLVLGMAKAPQQADRRRLHVEALERRAQRRPRRAAAARPPGRRARAPARAARPARAAEGARRRAGTARGAPGGRAPRGR